MIPQSFEFFVKDGNVERHVIHQHCIRNALEHVRSLGYKPTSLFVPSDIVLSLPFDLFGLSVTGTPALPLGMITITDGLKPHCFWAADRDEPQLVEMPTPSPSPLHPDWAAAEATVFNNRRAP